MDIPGFAEGADIGTEKYYVSDSVGLQRLSRETGGRFPLLQLSNFPTVGNGS